MLDDLPKKRAPRDHAKPFKKHWENHILRKGPPARKNIIPMVSQNLSQTLSKTTFSGRGQGQKSVGHTWATTESMRKAY